MGSAISCPCACSSVAPAEWSVVLEDQDVLEAPVLLQVDDAVAKCPEHVFDSLLGKSRQSGIVLGRLDDDLVRADAVHLVEHAFGLATQASLDAKRGKLVRDHAHRPASASRWMRRLGDRPEPHAGVLLSLPGQNGQKPPFIFTGSRLKSVGRLARSVEMMTQRPTIGSLRSSGTD